MGYRKISQHYNRTKIETAGKLDLIIMCYEKSIQLLNQAKEHLTEQEFEKKAYKFHKALDIISELRGSLDIEKGGQIAVNLDSIYDYMSKRLIQGDIQKDASVYDECVGILNELKEAWETISDSKDGNRVEIDNTPDINTRHLSQMFT